MKLNCKQGDLAVIVRSTVNPQTVGMIVQCVKYKPSPIAGPAWEIDRSVAPHVQIGMFIHAADWIRDANLRPLRDNDGTDETLTWRDVPTPTGVPA